MDNFKIIYKILRTFEAAMDLEEFNLKLISCEHYGISYERWVKIISNLINDGYIRDFHLQNLLGGNVSIDARRASITTKGLEYLAGNPIMIKFAKQDEGIIVD